jgi:hypothetical protein
MKRHLSLYPWAAILIMAFAGFCFAQPQATASPSPAAKPKAPHVSKAQPTKQLSKMEEMLWTAWKNKDPKPFEKYLAADAALVDGSGVGSKKDVTGGMNACNINSFSLSDWKLTTINSTAAFITYKAVQDGTCGGTAIPSNIWAGSIWVKRGGGWVAVSHQESPKM